MRVVSLCPSLTETVAALGRLDVLAGVTRYCVHPREALAGIPRVGGTKNPDLPAIRLARPDLVLMNAEENRLEDIEVLALEFPVDVSHPRRVADVPPLLRHLGGLLHRQEEAERLARGIEEESDRLVRAAPAPFRYAVLVWKDPWMTVSNGTYAADLLGLAGGVNALGKAGGGEPYPTVTEEEIAAAAPEILLLPDEPYRFGEGDAASWSSRLPNVSVRLVPGEELFWHGVRTLRGLAAVGELARSAAPREAR